MADRTAGQRDEEGVRRFVERLAMMLTEWGFPRMPARVLGSMMTADEDSLTAADLAERLGVSAAAISGAVRYLTHIGMISRRLVWYQGLAAGPLPAADEPLVPDQPPGGGAVQGADRPLRRGHRRRGNRGHARRGEDRRNA